MRWFRSRARLGAYLALLALAFQLVVSFGHVHLEGFAAASKSTLASVQAQPSELQSSDPAGQEAPALADGYCAVCALIHLAGGLTPAQTPSLPLAISFHRLRFAAAIEFDLTRPHRVLAAARAPPIA